MIQAAIKYGDMIALITTDAPYNPDIADDLMAKARQQLITAQAQLAE